MRTSLLILIILAGLSSAPAWAEVETAVPAAGELKLDVKTAVDLARAHSYPLRSAALDLETRRTAAQSAWSLFYPTASVYGSFETGTQETAGLSTDATRLSAGASVGLSLNPLIAFQIRQLWNDYQSGRIGYQQADAKLAIAVKKYYYTLVVSRAALDLLRKQVEAAARRLETAEYRLKLGLASPVDRLSAEYAYQDKRSSLVAAESAWRINLLQLMQVCGIGQDVAVALAEGVPESPAVLRRADPAALAANADLRLLRLNREAAEILKVMNEAAAFWPMLTVSVEAGRGFQTDPFARPLFAAGSWTGSGQASFKVNLSVPLDVWLPYSGARQTLAAREAAVKKLEYAILEKTETDRRQAETLILTLRQIESQLDSLKVNVALAEQNLKLVEELYNSGKKSLLDVKDAENGYYGALVKLANARYDAAAAALDLEYLTQTGEGSGPPPVGPGE
jgi:outer membrane protein TolC